MEKTLIGYCYTLQKAKITKLYTLQRLHAKTILTLGKGPPRKTHKVYNQTPFI